MMFGFFRNLSIFKKIFGLALFLISVGFVVVLLFLLQTSKMEDKFNIKQLENIMLESGSLYNKFAVTGDTKLLEEIGENRVLIKSILSDQISDEDNESIGEAVDNYFELIRETEQYVRSLDFSEKLLNQENELQRKIDEQEAKISRMISELSDKYSESVATYSAMLMVVYIGSVIGVFLISFFIANYISRSIKLAKDMTGRLAGGDTDARMNLDQKDEIGELGCSFDYLSEGLGMFAGKMEQVADGNFSVNVKLESKNDKISPALIKIASTLKEVFGELKALVDSALEGKLDSRGHAERFEGDYKKTIMNINALLDAVLQPIDEGTGVLAVMAKGDFTERVNGSYKGDHQKIKRSINQLADSLSELIGEVTLAVDSTASAGENIASSSQQVSAGFEEQADRIRDVLSGVEQITKTTHQTTQYASKAAENSREATDIASGGRDDVENTIMSMNKIAEIVISSSEVIAALGESSREIGEILTVINEIADQTNLLALNAAIEAARAGEEGRGFAVVADEVRKLAEKTTKATHEIADMIKRIQVDTDEAVKSMDVGKSEAEKGKTLATEARKSMEVIVKASGEVSQIVEQVAAASEQQSAAAEEIGRNIESINDVSMQSSEAVERVSEAAENLRNLTIDLKALINKFSINKLSEADSAVRKIER